MHLFPIIPCPEPLTHQHLHSRGLLAAGWRGWWDAAARHEAGKRGREGGERSRLRRDAGVRRVERRGVGTGPPANRWDPENEAVNLEKGTEDV